MGVVILEGTPGLLSSTSLESETTLESDPGNPGLTMFVEVSFTTDPGDTPVWVDVSEYVRDISWNRGRSSELQDVSAGTCSVVLDNRDRRFDPDHATGPHFGDLLPMRRMRVRAEYTTDSYDVFNGYVEAYRQSWPGKVDATTTLECVDAFKVLSLAEVTSEPGYPEVVDETLDPLWGYWRLNEPASTKIRTGGKLKKKQRVGPRERRVRTVVGQAGPEAIAFAAGTGYQNNGDVPGPLLGDSSSYGVDNITGGYFRVIPVDGFASHPGLNNVVTVSMMVHPDNIGFANAGIIAGPTTNADSESAWALELDFGTLFWWINFTDGTNRALIGPNLSVGTWYHVVATWNGATGLSQLFVDGARVATGTNAGKTIRRGTGGNPVFIGNREIPTGFVAVRAVISEAVISEKALQDSANEPDVLRLYASAKAGFGAMNDLPLSGARIEEILDPLFTGSDIDIGTGTVNVLPQRLDGSSRLDLIRDVERTEAGVFFISKDGKPTFRGRDFRTSSPGSTSHGTFGDTTSEIPYTDITTSFDEEFLFNVVTVTREDGFGATQEDATSKASFLPRRLEVSDTLDINDAGASNLASALLARYKDPALRVRSITVMGRADFPDTYEQMLAREIYDRILVKRRPPGGGDPVEFDVRIQGLSGNWTVGVPLQMRWELAPEDH